MNILFVCTGNIFRSVTAEYCFNQMAGKIVGSGLRASSAGIEARPQLMDKALVKALMGLNIDPILHQQRKLTGEMLQEAEMTIALAKKHQDFIRTEFGFHVPLFNELIGKGDRDVADVDSMIHTNHESVEVHIHRTVSYIHENMPKVLTSILAPVG